MQGKSCLPRFSLDAPSQQEPRVGFFKNLFAKAPSDRFEMAVFKPDGSENFRGFVDPAQVPAKLLEPFGMLLDHEESSFRMSVSMELAQIELQLTRLGFYAALGTFYADGHIATTLMLLSGTSDSEEQEVMQDFHDAIAGILAAKSIDPKAFDALYSHAFRPLAATIHWSNKKVKVADYQQIIELEGHLATAFFKRAKPPAPPPPS